jgi:hypothetical protein
VRLGLLMFPLALARVISIVGHPVLVLPVAVVVSGQVRGVSVATRSTTIGVTVGIGVVVLVFSAVRVWLGHWKHVDASEPAERNQLNGFTVVLLLGAALAGFLSSGGTPDLYLWPACSGGVVLAAMALRRRMKLSQHVAFDLFAAMAVLPSMGAAVAIALLTGAVAWSRLALGRHTRAEVAVGTVVGLGAGAAFQALGIPR